jgi:S1-C subfamily serine protease
MAVDAPPVAADTSRDGRGRRWVRPLAYALVGAVVAAAVFTVVDRRGSSDSNQVAAPTTASTSTNVAPAVAAKVYRTIQPSLVVIQAQLGGADTDTLSLGSGVIVNASGQVMTAAHVIDQATRIEITFADGTRAAAQVVSTTPERDIAVLQPEQPPRVIVPAVLGGGVRIGDDTYSVGNPLGLDDSLTAGVVSGLDRSIGREDGAGELSGLIQFDAAVNPGSSGGPLLNRQGQVVGIVTALANPSGQRFFVGIGFAVPITSAGGGASIPPS